LSVATYTADSTFVVDDRERLFDTQPVEWENAAWRGFDVNRDDDRFLMITTAGGAGTFSEGEVRFIYIQNFFEELTERVGN